MSNNRLYYQPVQEAEVCCFPDQFQSLDHQYYMCYSNCRHGSDHFLNRSNSMKKKYCNNHLESSSAIIGNSSSTLCSFSSSGSPMSRQGWSQPSYPTDLYLSPDNTINNYSSPMSGSCVTTDDVSEFRHKLRELETAMLGPDSDTLIDSYESTLQGGIGSPEIDSWRQMVETIPRRRGLKQVLIACAKAVGENDDMSTTQGLMAELRQMVSVVGEPIQRLGAYMLEGLVARLSSSGSLIYKEPPSAADLLSYMHTLYEVCPYFKFGYMSANGAIAEAMKDENRVHIIDFQIGQGSQWVTLIQAFAARPGGPPHIRITGVDDSASAYARGGGLHIVGHRLSRLAESFKVPFEFHGAATSGCDVQCESLWIRPGESLAVNFAFMLHRMPDESVSTQNHRDRLLRLVKSLSPKVVTLVEQESNTNTAPFLPRFLEAMDYYKAMFESLDLALPREHKQRINVEQHCLARHVVNVIACEGTERVERHELLGKWKSRFRMAGFTTYPLSSLVNATIKRLLENYCDRYRLEERDGALYLGWTNRDLVASCAWR